MKELYIAPEVKLIGFEASEKIAALEETLSWSGFGDITLSGGTTVEASTDIKIPLT